MSKVKHWKEENWACGVCETNQDVFRIQIRKTVIYLCKTCLKEICEEIERKGKHELKPIPKES